MNRQEMQQRVDELNEELGEGAARIIEFGHKPHVHADLRGRDNGDILVIGEDGEEHIIPEHPGKK